MLTTLTKFPAPFFGGKRFAAPTIWEALGDVPHYVEPFCGSCAVLLERPHPCNRPYHSETVNDADGLLVNALRALQLQPQATAEAASWFVSEADFHARQLAILQWQQTHELEHLMGDPTWCDPQIAGYWLYGLSLFIGAGWCSGQGPWIRDQATGRIIDRRQQPKDAEREEPGLSRKLPHLHDNGKGTQRHTLREPGISRKLPHLGNNGKGTQHAGLREPGISRKLPRLGNNGEGTQRHTLREPGLSRELPHLTTNGRGTQHAGLREPGIRRKLPHLHDNGKGTQHAGLREPGVTQQTPTVAGSSADWAQAVEADYQATDGFHPMTMPELRRWFAYLSARLRHVRIVNGDYRRCLTNGALKTLSVGKLGPAGVFLDPPYTHTERDAGIYSHDTTKDRDLPTEVRTWCLDHGDDPELRIVLAGFADEGHEVLEAHGWTVRTWFTDGFLTGGMGNTGKTDTHQQHRERLWCSPYCVKPQVDTAQLPLW